MGDDQKYTIRQRAPQSDEYEFIVYLDERLTEFGSEFGGRTSSPQSIITTTKKVIAERYPTFKVTMVKVMMGGIVVAAMPLTIEESSARATS